MTPNRTFISFPSIDGSSRRIAAVCLVGGLMIPGCSGEPADTDSASSGGSASSGAMTSTAETMTTAPTTGSSGAPTSTDSGQSGSEAMTTAAVTEGGTTTATTGITPECAGAVDNADCAGDTPYCVDTVCVGCQDLSCPEVDPTKPACDAGSGRCFECLTSDDCVDKDKPACDLDTATCAPCTEHEQCPETACNLESGQCFPPENVLYVENDIILCSDAKADFGQTPEQPMCTLSGALKRAAVGVPLTITVKAAVKPQVLPAGLPAGDFIVAIVPRDAAVPTLTQSSDLPALTVSAGNKVFMLKIRITAGNGIKGTAVTCDGASLWLDRQRISATNTALAADDCRLHVRRTVVFANTGGGLLVGGSDPAQAKLWLESSFLTENNGSSFGGLRLEGAASAQILYSTIALNKSITAPIDCVAGWSGKLELRNSAIIDAGPHYGAGCGNTQTVITSYDSTDGDKATLKITTFSSFVEGEYRALAGGKLADQAVWKAGDPAGDQDGTPRPTTEGAADYAGADRPQI